MRDPVSGARVRRAVDAQLRRAGVEAQDADDVRTEVVLALLGAPAAELPLPLELVCARASVIARNKAVDHGRRRRARPARARRRAARARRAGRAARDRWPTVSTRSPRWRTGGGSGPTSSHALERLDAPQLAAIAAHAEGGAARAAGLPRSTYYRVLAHAQARLRSDLRGRLAGLGALGAAAARWMREVFQHVEAAHAAAVAATAAVAITAAVVLGAHDEGAHRGAPSSPCRPRAAACAPVVAGAAARARPAPPHGRRRPDLPLHHSRARPAPRLRHCVARRRAPTTRPPTTAERTESPMRPTAMLALFLLALCAAGAGARRHVRRAFRRRRAHGRCGLGAEADARGDVRLRGHRHGLPERRHAGRPRRLLLPLQRARGRADRRRRRRPTRYSKASAATALCAYSFSALPGATLRRCGGGTFEDGVAPNGSNWVELGLYNEGDVADCARDCPRQQRHLRRADG